MALVIGGTSPPSLQAHALGAYMQAAYVSLSPSGLQLELVLAPGVAVADSLMRRIDINRDGHFDARETSRYLSSVTRDLRWTVDGRVRELALRQATWPTMDEFRQGTGRIVLHYDTALRLLDGTHHLRFENRHVPVESAYLANTYAPSRGVRVDDQSRDWNQRQLAVTFAVSVRGEPTMLREPMNPATLALVASSTLTLLLLMLTLMLIAHRRAHRSGDPVTDAVTVHWRDR